MVKFFSLGYLQCSWWLYTTKTKQTTEEGAFVCQLLHVYCHFSLICLFLFYLQCSIKALPNTHTSKVHAIPLKSSWHVSILHDALHMHWNFLGVGTHQLFHLLTLTNETDTSFGICRNIQFVSLLLKIRKIIYFFKLFYILVHCSKELTWLGSSVHCCQVQLTLKSSTKWSTKISSKFLPPRFGSAAVASTCTESNLQKRSTTISFPRLHMASIRVIATF